MSNYEELDAVHIVSHGETGQLSFGNATLNSETLPEYEEVIEEWSLALNADADLLLYGCDVTLNGQGHSFVQQLSQITDADIAASIDLTGSGGDWELETAVGEIETSSAFNDEIESLYEHTLVDAGIDIGVGGGGGGGGDFNDPNFGGGGDRPVDGNNDSDGEDDDDDDNNNNGGDSGQPSFRTDDLVDAEYYLSRNPDVAQNGASAEEHYFNNGRLEGRYPNQVFESFDISPRVLVGSVDFAEDDYESFKNLANNLAAESNEVAIALPIVVYKIIEGAIVIAITGVSIDTVNKANSLREAVEDSDNDIFITPPPTTGPLPPEQIPSGISRSEAELEFVRTPPFDFTRIGEVELTTFPNGKEFIDFIEDGKFEFPSEQNNSSDNFFTSNNSGSVNPIDNDDFWAGEENIDPNPSYGGVSNPEANNIANGHAFPDHRNEFPGVNTREDYAQVIDGVINNATDTRLDLNNGRRAYWDDLSQTLVVIDPQDADNGTAYKPDRGKQEFDELE